ncbi:hypothetical protein F5887DRAFT_1188501 [Amanita rubescens]|nr:hypothetical protein F5887DRAFT_1188501 [Amanita rubescens]
MEYDGGISVLEVTEIPRAASRGADADLIATHLGPKYVVPAGIANAKRSIAGNSRTAAKRIFRSRDGHPSVTRKSDQKQSIEIPSGSFYNSYLCSLALELSVSSYYVPHLLPDLGGPVFRLVNAKLMQREVVDSDDNLVPPWEMYDKLRPGTLVLMKVQLLAFDLPDRQNDGVRKIYRVMAHSEDVELPDKCSNNKSSQVMSLSTERDDTDDALDALFESKKRKIKDEANNAASSSSTTDCGSSTKTKGKRGKAKVDEDVKLKVAKLDKGKRPDCSSDLVNNSDNLEDYDMVAEIN